MASRSPKITRHSSSPHEKDLLLISALALFLELACIRWFSSHVFALTFFTNIILLASFLGLSAGCLLARRKINLLFYSPFILAGGMGLALLLLRLTKYLKVKVASPQYIFFGTVHSGYPNQLSIPIELLGSLYFLIIAVAFLGIGQETGRALNAMKDKLRAYSVNVLGSLVGIVLLALVSFAQLSPLWWFLAFGFGVAAYAWRRLDVQGLALPQKALFFVPLAALPFLSMASNFNAVSYHGHHEFFWSPYYRVGYSGEPEKTISVNHITHQDMVPIDAKFPAYALPHAFNRDSGGKPYKDVLIIGAGSGNDVSRALQWGADHVDAVEIDPVIYNLGKQHHPNSPYADPRVTVHINDGRNFLASTKKTYDLIIYALVDSLVLQSGYSNVRLESFLFTNEALSQVRDRLKPTGTFVMYNYFRQGWLVSRLNKELGRVFTRPPVILTYPKVEKLDPTHEYSGFTIFMAGATDRVEASLNKYHEYRLVTASAPQPNSPNGFLSKRLPAANEAEFRFSRTEILPSSMNLPSPTDTWPFLYLQNPMLPEMTLRGMALMATLSFLLIFALLWGGKQKGAKRRVDWPKMAAMFFLGAGFMLVESRAVVNMALLFGGTWMVNSVVFFAVLVMIFFANQLIPKLSAQWLWLGYAGLTVALAVNWLVPISHFVGWSPEGQILGSCLLTFAPIFFAAIVFGISFRDSETSDWAFGANVAGAMAGGLLENFSLLIGFQHILILAFVCYAFSFVAQQRGLKRQAA